MAINIKVTTCLDDGKGVPQNTEIKKEQKKGG